MKIEHVEISWLENSCKQACKQAKDKYERRRKQDANSG